MSGRAAPAAVVVAVGTLAIGVGAAIGFLHGYMAPALRADLGISRAQVGVLVSVYFGSTGIGSIAGGILSDRLGARLAVVADLAAVAAASALLVVLPTYPSLLVASVAAGLAYSMGNAGTNMAIGVAVPSRDRGLALTVKTAGVPAMATVAALLAPWGADRVGWRPIMGIVGLVAVLVGVLALSVLPSDRPTGPAVPRSSLPAGFTWFPVAAFLLIAGSQPLFSWSVSWFEEAHLTAIDTAGALSALATLVGLVGMIAIGRRSDVLGGARRTGVIAVMVLVCALAALLLTAGAAVGVVVGTVALSIAMASQLGAIGVMHAAVVDVVPLAIGRASGVTMTGYYLGALVSPALFGLLVDVTDGYTIPWGLCTVALAASAVAFRQAGVATRSFVRGKTETCP